jgi:UDP-glucuronate decarboxylase
MVVIAWITPELGTAPFDKVGALEADVEIIDVRDLVDRAGNLPEDAGSKIDQALESLRAGRRVVVCCDYGMSRSNAIAAGVLARWSGIRFSESVRRVLAATGESAIKIEVLGAVRAALKEQLERGETSSGPKGGSRQILVTGGSGFLGRAFLSACPSRIRLLAPSSKDLDLLSGTVLLDLLVREQAIEAVLHLANPRIYTTNQAMGESLVLLKNVLDVCLENGLRLITLSSWEVYSGYRATFLRASEDLPRHPKGNYGLTKDLCERLIEHAHRLHGLRYTLLRPSPVYGPGGDRPRFLFNFHEKAIRGEPIVTHRFRNGYPALDLLFIEDMTRALVSAVELMPDGVFNLGTGLSTSTVEVAELIIDLVGSSSSIEHRQIQGEAPNVVMDSRRAEEVLGWRPRTKIADGLRRTLRSPQPNTSPTA